MRRDAARRALDEAHRTIATDDPAAVAAATEMRHAREFGAAARVELTRASAQVRRLEAARPRGRVRRFVHSAWELFAGDGGRGEALADARRSEASARIAVERADLDRTQASDRGHAALARAMDAKWRLPSLERELARLESEIAALAAGTEATDHAFDR
jgi:hypothetical protein